MSAPYLSKRLGMTVDDIEQELTIAAWEAAKEVDESKGDHASVAFVNQKMEWRVKDLLRRSLVRKEVAELEVEPEGKEETVPTETEDEIALVKLKIGFLKRADRKYLLMALDGMTPEQISEATGIEMIRVKKSLQTSKATLREVFRRIDQ